MKLINVAKTLALWFDPLRQAIFARNIPFTYRWRLLILQALILIVIPLQTLPWTFSSAYRIIWIPSRGKHLLRALVFEPTQPSRSQQHKLRPLHIDFHAGAFVGGIAEVDNAFCHQVCQRTGAVVVSVDYRVAPQHIYPAAHEDCEDAVAWLLANAEQKFNADPKCLTVSGFSAGGNLMMVAGSRARAAVGFYGSIDLRLPPWQKPKAPTFPNKDPTAVLLPLYDSYAGPVRHTQMQDARLHPILKRTEDLPANVLLIIPSIDTLVHEELTFVERVKADLEAAGLEKERMVEGVVFEEAFHGWFELPYLPKSLYADKIKAQDLAVDFIAKAQRSREMLRE